MGVTEAEILLKWITSVAEDQINDMSSSPAFKEFPWYESYITRDELIRHLAYESLKEINKKERER